MGSALAPELEFSFLKYNFGMHFIHCIGMTPATHTLMISNRNDRGIRYRLKKNVFHDTLKVCSARFNYDMIVCV